ncbi:hypothetical protein D8674_023423 [Pyrus ussuriensis x Pyrus communis]|uniref:Uncharacterized protein n=1 Tax=Pyrus ussuriensis x Pyrus communis TaxID=2448454 RepID=A0A5N5FRV7_9ROSA|nr:hypothetical protein D8674_039060 [Pyrus ussuriensis x Pyrus communis]KAB2616835.1 hypothetical protein D8674_023423 [Pyrus ussuriensis x Pyrus communis]
MQGRITLGCGDTSGNAPFVFTDKEFEASILSLMKQTGMMEETGSQCMEETTISLTREDNLRTGNAEHLTCAGRAMQEMRFDLGGTSNFGSPHGQSLDLIGSDDRTPELEGFVMQTDDEPTSIAGKGISFDEGNLPSTAIEHASILEHLCQSACMQTPVACSSASNKLHKIPNLYQSVPTGLLEGVDMRTMNDAVRQLKDSHSYSSEEVGQAFYGSKNCLAFAASSQNRADPETIFPPESFCCISEGTAGLSSKMLICSPLAPKASIEQQRNVLIYVQLYSSVT